jgi:hypothetical protein
LGFDWGNQKRGELEDALGGDPLQAETLLQFANSVSKGRLAQRIAAENAEVEPPTYVEAALRYLVGT